MDGRRILVVEDEALIALDLMEVLTEAGFEVCGLAATEHRAVELARLHRPALAVVDMRLAEGSGLAAALQMHRECGTRVLFATGTPKDLAGVAEVLGAWYVPKPCDPRLVVRALWALALDEPLPLGVGRATRS
jgi:DNA-binding response OmpR family regulator